MASIASSDANNHTYVDGYDSTLTDKMAVENGDKDVVESPKADESSWYSGFGKLLSSIKDWLSGITGCDEGSFLQFLLLAAAIVVMIAGIVLLALVVIALL